MANLSDYLEAQWMNMIVGGTSFTPPATYMALFTSDPTDANTGTEVSGNGYARVQVNQDGATQPYWNTLVDSAGAKLTDNNGQISFPKATGNWGTITHVGIFDAASGGNLLWHGALSPNKDIGTNDTVVFDDGDLDLTLA